MTLPAHAFAHEPSEPEPAIPRHFRVSTVARALDHSRQSVYLAIKRGDLKAVRIFGSLRVREDDLLRYLGERQGCGR